MATTNNIDTILEAFNDYANDLGLVVDKDSAYEAACFIRDTNYESWADEIEVGRGELDKRFNIYRIKWGA